MTGVGNGPIAAFVDALAAARASTSASSTTPSTRMSAGDDARAAAYVEAAVGDGRDDREVWGVGIDGSTSSPPR